MALQTPPSMYGPGPLVDLGTADDLLVDYNSKLISTLDSAVIGSGGNHSLSVDGAVVSSDGTAVYIKADAINDYSNVMIITGRVEDLSGGAAIVLGGNASVINNSGLITGSVFLGGADTTTYSKIVNSGTIFGDVHSQGEEQVVLVNSGRIVEDGSGLSFDSYFSTTCSIVNSGVMIGDVNLGVKNDKFDGRSGLTIGQILGNDGNDVIYGGQSKDYIHGGNGNDTLIGGLGRDTFWFDTKLNASTNVDRITDFTAVDDTFELQQSYFSKITKTGTLASSQFKDIGTGAKLDSDDRIVYNHKTGDVFYDADGSGATKMVKFAHLDHLPTLTNADFIIYA